MLPAWWLYRERLSARAGIALAVGFGGLLVVAVPGGGGSGAELSLLSALAVTAGTLMARRLGGVDVVVASAAHFLVGGAVLAGVAAAVEGAPHIAWTPRFVAVLAFLGLAATAATTLAWFVETRRCPLSSLTPWMFLVPVVGLVIGVTVLGERPDAWTVTGVVLVLLSMWVALTHHGIAGAACRGPAAAGGHAPGSPGKRPVRSPHPPIVSGGSMTVITPSPGAGGRAAPAGRVLAHGELPAGRADLLAGHSTAAGAAAAGAGPPIWHL